MFQFRTARIVFVDMGVIKGIAPMDFFWEVVEIAEKRDLNWPECSRMFQNVSECSKIFQNVLACSTVFENVLKYPRRF